MTVHKLVLKYFRSGGEAPNGAVFQIGGRRGGMIGAVLTAVGLGEDVSLTVTPTEVVGEVNGKEGRSTVAVPMHRVAATSCGHERPVKALITAAWVAAASLLFAVLARDASALLGLVISCGFVIKYLVGKSLWIRVVSFGGTGVGVGFRPGLLEQMSIDPAKVEAAIASLNQLVLYAREPDRGIVPTQSTVVATGTSPAASYIEPTGASPVCTQCGAYLEADSRFCGVCGKPTPMPAGA